MMKKTMKLFKNQRLVNLWRHHASDLDLQVLKKKPKRPSCDLVRQSMLYHDHNNDYFIVDLEVLVFL